MANEPYNFNGPIDDEEYRRRAEAKAKKRKKRQMQRLILLGAFALGAILLIVVIVLIFRSIFGKDKKDPVSVPPSSYSLAEPEPQYSYPIAPDASLWSLKLVNAQNPLEDGHAMDEELSSIVQGVVAYWFDERMVESLSNMIAACNEQVEGGSLTIVSGYRSAKTQNERYEHLVEVYKGQGDSEAIADVKARLLEPPAGLSEHQLGLAVDFVTATVSDTTNAFAETPECQWLLANAAEYGFIMRYTLEKEAITGMSYQPYHWRYVGVEEARAISGAGICLEEYLLAVPDTTPAEDPVVEPEPDVSTDTSGEASAPV